MTLTPNEVEAILHRLEAGGTMKDESAQLGMSYAALRTMLEEVAGYLSAGGRLKEIIFVLYDDPAHAAFRNALRDLPDPWPAGGGCPPGHV